MAITFDFLMEVLARVNEYYRSVYIAYLKETRSIMNMLRPPALNLNYVRDHLPLTVRDQLPIGVFPYWSGSFASYKYGEYPGLNTVPRAAIRYLKDALTPWNQDDLFD